MVGQDDIEIGIKGGTGELLMLSKKERILLRAILRVVLDSDSSREVISRKLSKEHLEIGYNLLKEMGGKQLTIPDARNKRSSGL